PSLLSPPDIAPTRSSFAARWNPINRLSRYRLDVSTSSSFSDYVPGYRGLDVGTATSWMVTGLKPGTTYYYRVSASGGLGTGVPSEPASASTVAGAGLVIDPTFDSSITGNPNAAAIEAMVNRAIALYESLFSDPVTVEILFRYSTTRPNGTAIGDPNLIALSSYVIYSPSWSTYINALQADAKTANDAAANASLPPNPLSTSIITTSANGRAVGGDTPPAMFADGTVTVGGPYDGIVTLNAAAPYQFVRPVGSGSYDAQSELEHEVDEVLGLGSYLDSTGSNLRPQDLFSWSVPGTRSTTKFGERYFSIDSGRTAIVEFNQTSGFDYGDWQSYPCPQANPYVQNAFRCQGQSADISRMSPEGINLDVIGYDAISPKGQLLNISTRMEVLRDDNVLIAGFIVTGTDAKKIIVRGIGPSLPVPGPLADPTLELHQGSATLATNDNWKINDQTGQSQEAEIRATTLPPNNDSEAAIVATLNPGSYTTVMAGKNGGTGVGSVEVYDLAQSANARLANISSRGFVDTNDNVMIAGFIIGGPSGDNGRVLIRAIGPSLTNSGVSGALADPALELHDGNGTTIATNDNWKMRSDGTSQQAEIQSTTLQPTNDSESALLRTLAPGNYTAIVRGNNNTTGVGLAEVYNLQ
ncbi:MAG TPA: fibronectin type III domain-containing protein, partial [Chthoniobacterales bacterium]|nr:fibronectin type III domain-containing protein [Chthoniobacterales bacterium]